MRKYFLFSLFVAIILVSGCLPSEKDKSSRTRITGHLFYFSFDGFVYVGNDGGPYGSGSGFTMFLDKDGKPYETERFCRDLPHKKLCSKVN